MTWVPLLLLSLAAVIPLSSAIGQDDNVTLPYLLFKPNFDTYSGFLNAGKNGTDNLQMHYLLHTSRGNASADPILVWLSGGPGCSSQGGLFEELGPFYVTKNSTLFENKYSWNRRANLLALESPVGVGFSYDKKQFNVTSGSDDDTAWQNYYALRDFFNRVQTQFAGRDFFISGESYAGIYIPTLSKLIVDGINKGDFPNANFKGILIGNGFMNVQYNQNSQILWSYYHGRVSVQDFAKLKQTCAHQTANNPVDIDYFNFTQYLKTSDQGQDWTSDGSVCGDLIYNIVMNDNYNYYQDCYPGAYDGFSKEEVAAVTESARARRKGASTNMDIESKDYQYSNDNQNGYPCWNGMAHRKYANLPEVQEAFHIPKEWREKNLTYVGCNNQLGNNWNLQYPNTADLFTSIITNFKGNFRILIYNGDVDTVCNFLGDAWVARDVAVSNNMRISMPQTQWYFRNQTAGYVKRYVTADAQKTMDVLSVKGAGHFVPNDRGPQSIQMVNNFLFPTGKDGQVDYNDITNANPTPASLPPV